MPGGEDARGSHTPEVVHELPELVHPPGQRHDDVDQRAGHVQLFLLHLHDGAEGPEQDQAPEFVLLVPSERELVQSAFIPLCAVDACGQTRERAENSLGGRAARTARSWHETFSLKIQSASPRLIIVRKLKMLPVKSPKKRKHRRSKNHR